MFRNFRADYRYPSIYQIPLETISSDGVKYIFTDLDNTLVADGAVETDFQLSNWLAQTKLLGLEVVIISNNKSEQRVADFANPNNLAYRYRSGKPSPDVFYEMMDKYDIEVEEAIMIGDRITTDIFGANRAGLTTILVEPVDPKEPFGIRCMRIIENILAKLTKEDV
ncbi:YqeG family HAD IIIA-type phosphatase [Culicoidibacter larvae]|uniref:YqeG family HAD IIIA-type phosphatase n=1 Tax=Culicoidibacter larvae TaxID=2579976 RepID=A0A5R8QDC0_9FIRM|nr:YqeG family HAD IIIA-type phosphatase [Culicoidibacter larvae]TLG74280.1 YqeG family HAD IIIA-type phosphatase [Culicoidibacter larvae]